MGMGERRRQRRKRRHKAETQLCNIVDFRRIETVEVCRDLVLMLLCYKFVMRIRYSGNRFPEALSNGWSFVYANGSKVETEWSYDRMKPSTSLAGIWHRIVSRCSRRSDSLGLWNSVVHIPFRGFTERGKHGSALTRCASEKLRNRRCRIIKCREHYITPYASF